MEKKQLIVYDLERMRNQFTSAGVATFQPHSYGF